MPSPVKVATVQFEDLVSLGLRQMIGGDPSLDLVANDVPLAQLESVLLDKQPAVVLLNFGSLPSAVTVRELHQAHPGTRFVVLANRPTAKEANQMLSLGATACVSKETQARDIVNAIHLASRGMQVLPRSATSVSGDGTGDFGPDILTPREADVLELLQEGMTNAQIAHALSIGIETVRTHARNIYRKLGVESRRDLAKISQRPARSPATLQLSQLRPESRRPG